MKHPHAELLGKLYGHYLEGRFDLFLNGCSDKFTFQLLGKSAIVGKFTKANFIEGYASKLKSVTDGTYSLEVHDILASDLHATVLGTAKVTKAGKTTEMRLVHVWRFEEGKPLAGYEYPRDMYQFDEIFS